MALPKLSTAMQKELVGQDTDVSEPLSMVVPVSHPGVNIENNAGLMSLTENRQKPY